MRSILLPLARKGGRRRKLGLFAGIRCFMLLGSKYRGLRCGPSVISSADSLTWKQTKGSVTGEQACMASIPVRWTAVFQVQGRWMELAQQGTHASWQGSALEQYSSGVQKAQLPLLLPMSLHLQPLTLAGQNNLSRAHWAWQAKEVKRQGSYLLYLPRKEKRNHGLRRQEEKSFNSN